MSSPPVDPEDEWRGRIPLNLPVGLGRAFAPGLFFVLIGVVATRAAR